VRRRVSADLESFQPPGPKGVEFCGSFVRPFAPCFAGLVAGARVYLLSVVSRCVIAWLLRAGAGLPLYGCSPKGSQQRRGLRVGQRSTLAPVRTLAV
jgi:hypothetical protein